MRGFFQSQNHINMPVENCGIGHSWGSELVIQFLLPILTFFKLIDLIFDNFLHVYNGS